jgi:hypothetical protein
MAPIKKKPMPKKPAPPANRMFAGGPGGLVKPKKPKPEKRYTIMPVDPKYLTPKRKKMK